MLVDSVDFLSESLKNLVLLVFCKFDLHLHVLHGQILHELCDGLCVLLSELACVPLDLLCPEVVPVLPESLALREKLVEDVNLRHWHPLLDVHRFFVRLV